MVDQKITIGRYDALVLPEQEKRLPDELSEIEAQIEQYRALYACADQVVHDQDK